MSGVLKKSGAVLRYASAFALFFLTWIIIAAAVDSELLVPYPWRALEALGTYAAQGHLAPHLVATLRRFGLGLALAVVSGIPLGLLSAQDHGTLTMVTPLIDGGRSTPIVVLLPVFLILFGLTERSQIAPVVWTAGLVLFTHAADGTRQVRDEWIEVMRALGASKASIVWRVVLPAALPQLIVGLRIASSLALIVVLTAEMLLQASSGIGRVVADSHLLYDIPRMYGVIFLTGVLGMVINHFLLAAGSRICHWMGK